MKARTISALESVLITSNDLQPDIILNDMQLNKLLYRKNQKVRFKEFDCVVVRGGYNIKKKNLLYELAIKWTDKTIWVTEEEVDDI